MCDDRPGRPGVPPALLSPLPPARATSRRSSPTRFASPSTFWPSRLQSAWPTTNAPRGGRGRRCSHPERTPRSARARNAHRRRRPGWCAPIALDRVAGARRIPRRESRGAAAANRSSTQLERRQAGRQPDTPSEVVRRGIRRRLRIRPVRVRASTLGTSPRFGRDASNPRSRPIRHRPPAPCGCRAGCCA